MNSLTCLCILVLPSSYLLLADDEFVFPKERTTPSTRIIGGEEVIPHSYPFVVALVFHSSTQENFCGGTLISPQWVLTAAHCFDLKPEYILVYLGGHNITASEPSRVILESKGYVVHSDWNSKTLRNDIALIRLPSNVSLNQYISTVSYTTSKQTYAGQYGTTVGWGKTSDTTTQLSYVLKEVSSRIMSNEECASVYNEVLISSHICVSGLGPVGTCNGDSGGPLLVGNVQVGIVSFGYMECTYGYPSVFTRLSEFGDWIVDHTRDGGESLGCSLAVVMLVLVNFFNNL